ncbi:MAG TPA: polysaccharide pyruvyl transferase family protein [Acidimicrobiales bacterium]|nr:polysaccharide pyruvyl transferase family protein [Acidimicrobiales bacterium]
MPPQSASSALVAAWVGSTNLGDELVYAALAAKLAARGVAVTAVSTDPAATVATHGGAAVGQWDLRGLARATGAATGVILGGGGLLQDQTSAFNLPLHLSRTWLARARRTPVAGVGLGAGGLVTRLGRALVRRSMGAAVAVSCRDDASADLLASLGLPRPLVAADLALSLPRPAVEVQDRLVACLRPWTATRSRLPVALRSGGSGGGSGGGGSGGGLAPAWFLDAMATGLDEAAEQTGLAVHLVALQADRDDAVHRAVADRMRTPVTTATPTVATVVDEIATARVVVAMRYHAGIAAALAGRPSVLVGYSAKVPALAADLGEGAVGLDWDARALEGLAAAVGSILGQDAAMVEACEALRVRERGNDQVLDRLLGG